MKYTQILLITALTMKILVSISIPSYAVEDCDHRGHGRRECPLTLEVREYLEGMVKAVELMELLKK